MIASVTGDVAVRRPGEVVVETSGGVGYRLAVSTETLATVPPAGHETSLHTHLIVRDDGMSLYGFADEPERDLFLMLIGIQNVGPKVALGILSGGPPRELLRAIATGDAERFQAAPGVGKRTAERIIVELREKVAASVSPGGDEISVRRASDAPDTLAREALIALGFTPPEVDGLLDKAVGNTAEELIAGALRAAR